MIKFITEESEEKEELTFGMVQEDQFFIDKEGYLCQKVSYNKYVTIADEFKEPYCMVKPNINQAEKLREILQLIERIEF